MKTTAGILLALFILYAINAIKIADQDYKEKHEQRD